ncbi:glucose-1-phosphate adenylyltransferase subunit GlgD [Pullulanibacillus sp. KACC 23026]|uniref:glucose-1-phosphate adenylyltransferase subunit GlgD n=1 Tax=Pullulanibacillus sp. KACC 23026 TaxID=3028315 RepID=UPI0023AF7553|nr:glucose-1-phosphate adenylyltransferase subunit GlgD [Pullulanibacillus sp. KACC 23026]WEG13832.1 glucose-1-phosphate adenylyltransferase subunit GlgD [Pullulanibacillus sp. KACC 23026]
MDKVLGVINLVNESHYLKELTSHRCLSSVPFGGRYRLIDFTLSNFINADMTQVAIFPKERYRSLMDHLGSGKEWDLDRQTGGLYILPPLQATDSIKGDLQQFHDHLEIFKRTCCREVIISPGIHVNKIDYNRVIRTHRENGADLTVIYKAYDGQPVHKPMYHKCELDEQGNVKDIDLFTIPKLGDPVLLETYVIKKEILIGLIEECVGNEEYSFLKDVVKAHLQSLNVMGYPFLGKMFFIHSIESFLDCQLQLLDPELSHSLFYEDWDVLTKIKHEAPARFGDSSFVSNSLIANGCEIDGTVENSVLFRGVKVHPGAFVKNSIIMQKGEIEEGAYIENVIMDKQGRISSHRTLRGHHDPILVKKSEVI